MRRIERLLNLIIALLNTNRPYTAEEIRERIEGYGDEPTYEAFRRAFERDKEDLRTMGIPIEARPTDPLADVADGYIIPKKYYLPELDLEPDELAALHLAADTVLGVRDQAQSAWLKLSNEAGVSGTGPRLAWGTDIAAQLSLLGPLSSALGDRKAIEFDYRTAAGEQTTRRLEIYSLVQRRGHWYAVGRDRTRDALRSFKVTRILPPVKLIEGPYDIPDDFRADAHLPDEAWEIGDRTAETAVVRFDADRRWWAEQNMPDAPATDGPDGSLEVRIEVANPDALVGWVVEFGEGIEIVSPAPFTRLLDHIAPFAGDRA